MRVRRAIERAALPPPPARYHAGFPGLVVLHTDGGAVATASVRDGLRACGRFAVLLSHGNAVDLAGAVETARGLVAGTGGAVEVYAYDYPGYGLSEGRPTEAGLRAAARAVQAHMAAQGIGPARTILLGVSIGSAPTLALAAELTRAGTPPAGTVLVGAMTSAAALAPAPVAWLSWLLRADAFENIPHVRALRCPLLVVHGERDALVPLSHAKALCAAAQFAHAKLAVVHGADHNVLEEAPEAVCASFCVFLDTVCAQLG